MGGIFSISFSGRFHGDQCDPHAVVEIENVDALVVGIGSRTGGEGARRPLLSMRKP